MKLAGRCAALPLVRTHDGNHWPSHTTEEQQMIASRCTKASLPDGTPHSRRTRHSHHGSHVNAPSLPCIEYSASQPSCRRKRFCRLWHRIRRHTMQESHEPPRLDLSRRPDMVVVRKAIGVRRKGGLVDWKSTRYPGTNRPRVDRSLSAYEDCHVVAKHACTPLHAGQPLRKVPYLA